MQPLFFHTVAGNVFRKVCHGKLNLRMMEHLLMFLFGTLHFRKSTRSVTWPTQKSDSRTPCTLHMKKQIPQLTSPQLRRQSRAAQLLIVSSIGPPRSRASPHFRARPARRSSRLQSFSNRAENKESSRCTNIKNI